MTCSLKRLQTYIHSQTGECISAITTKIGKEKDMWEEEMWSWEDRNYNLWAHADEYEEDEEEE